MQRPVQSCIALLVGTSCGGIETAIRDQRPDMCQCILIAAMALRSIPKRILFSIPKLSLKSTFAIID